MYVTNEIVVLKTQLDVLIIQIYSVIKLYMFRESAESGWNCSSILTLLGSGPQTCMKLTSAECTVDKS